MSTEPKPTLDGVVQEILLNKLYKIELDNGHITIGRIPRSMLPEANILPGDKVELEMDPYDVSKCKIINHYPS